LTENLLLDTHIALWLDNGDERLRGSTVRLIEECWRKGGKILISAVTAWEIAQLASSGRIVIDLPASEWIERFVDDPGIEAVPLTHYAAAGAYRLHDLGHRDPADRLLIATAIELACPLITYDARIIRFGENHGSQYRFTIGA
jgi:PIN domain nuclease of toxin-antitoxin system